jgi:hypothetical protein
LVSLSVRRDALLGRFLLFGVAVGFAELPADAWLVDYRLTLDYSIGGGPMILFTPWYIILGEFGIALAFALLARTLRRGTWREATVAGIGGGFSIFICYAVAFRITDRLVG